jgi:hypothetical protein
VAVDPIRPVDARRDVAPVERVQLTPVERDERRRRRREPPREPRGGDGGEGLDIRA